MIYNDLKERLFAEVPYPNSVTQVIGGAEPWRNFCGLSQETKDLFFYPNHQIEADPGYRMRRRSAGREDKEYFHFYPENKEIYETYGLSEQVDTTSELREFFLYAHAVHKASTDFALELGNEIAKDVPSLAELIAKDRLRFLLRFLHYTPLEPTETSLADQHFDRSLYTLHLYENKAGLQFLNWNMEWTDAPIDTGKTVVFSGYRLEQLTEGKLQKTWHRVTRAEGEDNRYSAVLFVWSPDIPDYPKEARAQVEIPTYSKMN